MRENPKRAKRGSVYDRHSRKRWLVGTESPFGGNGTHVPCVHGCGTILSYETVQADRVIPGGSYARHNIQPSCGPCNIARGNNPNWKR
jgi:hypothetical protein